MVDPVANGVMPRVVLLARPGKAADNLADAVRQAGADLLVTVDPASTNEAALRAYNPNALLVALEPSIESSLDELDALLIDPQIIVIFDEADVAAHRSGWDAARWARHLSAKLRRDGNVLPPGTESDTDTDWQPSPGKVPQPSAAYADVDLSVFTQEAVARADSVPFDGMPHEVGSDHFETSLSLDAALLDAIPTVTTSVPPPLPQAPPAPAFEIESLDAAALELAALDDSPISLPPVAAVNQTVAQPEVDEKTFSYEGLSLEPFSSDAAQTEEISLDDMSIRGMSIEDTAFESVVLESVEVESSLDEPMSFKQDALDAFENSGLESMQLEGMQLESMQVESVQLEGHSPELSAESSLGTVTPMQLDDDAFFLEELSISSVAAQDATHTAIRFDSGFDMDSPVDVAADAEFSRAVLREPETVISFEDLIASRVAAAEAVPTSSPTAVPPPLPPSLPPLPSAPSEETPKTFSLGTLSLAPVDDPAPPAVIEASKPVASTIKSDLSALEARISSLSLVDLDDGAAKTGDIFGLEAAGVVLIEAGLGGPDPARQLLSAIPANFAAIVLVRLHLQGGRYDRLVAQMERASALPVALAVSGASANPGTIYFMPDAIGVERLGAKLRFVAEEGGVAAVFAALPANNSAVIFLSGSDPKLIDVAMAAAATGTMIAAQTPEDCYDGIACAELRTRGISSGLPAELAGRLASRWLS